MLYEFEEISDSVGRHFGDELVCHIANRLSESVRREDLLARVGDDEFAILLTEGSDLIAARAQAGRLLEVLRTLSRWIRSPCRSTPGSPSRSAPTTVIIRRS